MRLTDAGAARLRTALKGWAEAQTRFESAFGRKRTPELLAILRAVTATDFGADKHAERRTKRGP